MTPTTNPPTHGPAFETLTVSDWTGILAEYAKQQSCYPGEPKPRILFRIPVGHTSTAREVWVLTRGTSVEIASYCRNLNERDDATWVHHGETYAITPSATYAYGTPPSIWTTEEVDRLVDAVPWLVSVVVMGLERGRGRAGKRWNHDVRTVFEPRESGIPPHPPTDVVVRVDENGVPIPATDARFASMETAIVEIRRRMAADAGKPDAA